MPEAQVCPDFPQIQQPDHFLIAITHKPLTVWSREMNHWKEERVTQRDGIWQSGSYSFV
jgi:hypothetical protein